MCSLHFPGRNKSFSALPTVVKISCRQILDSETTTATQFERRTTGIDTQESTNEKLKTEHAALQRKYYH